MEALAIQPSLFATEKSLQPSRQHASRVAPLRLGLILDHRQWLELLADDWWPLKDFGKPLSLGVGKPTHVDLLPGRIPVIAWLDPARLPQIAVQVRRNGQWIETTLALLEPTDEELSWPVALPLFAMESFSTTTENERQRLLAYAQGYSGLAPLEQNIDIERSFIFPAATTPPRPDCPLLPPRHWDALRGAAAMAVWAVPAVAPWLDVLCASLGLEKNSGLANALQAPWWNEAPWQKPEPVAAAPSYSLALWRAIVTTLQEVRLQDGWQPNRILDLVVAKVLTASAAKPYQTDLDLFITETRAILQDRQYVDVARGNHDPLGLTLQLILLRPKPEQFATWRNDLLAMPPMVWWTGATLTGLLAGYRYLDAHYTGSGACRRLLALRTWQLAMETPFAINWPDLPPGPPTWQSNGNIVTLAWGKVQWAERKENSRGKWYAADLTLASNRQAAIALARTFYKAGLHTIIRFKDALLPFDGAGTMGCNLTERTLAVTGEVALQLPGNVSIEEDLNVTLFRDWVLRGSIPEILPPPPITQSFPIPARSRFMPKQPGLTSLFPPEGKISVAAVPGLSIVNDFISPDQEKNLIQQVDQALWLDDLSRRVQHYGWKYDYKSRKISRDTYLGPLPQWAQELAQKLLDHKLVPELPDQVIVNEYIGEQSISKHVDCLPCFRGPIVTISLLESWEMIFRHPDTKEKVAQLLNRYSASILSGAARETWTHEIPKRQKEPWGKRGRRISLTFRKVNAD